MEGKIVAPATVRTESPDPLSLCPNPSSVPKNLPAAVKSQRVHDTEERELILSLLIWVRGVLRLTARQGLAASPCSASTRDTARMRMAALALPDCKYITLDERLARIVCDSDVTEKPRLRNGSHQAVSSMSRCAGSDGVS
jgi:hypothetical protein